MERGEFTSLALEGNLLGDPATRGYYIYLPPGYEASESRYPVVYVLHGYTPDVWSWIGTWQNVANAAIATKKAGEMILVFPDASNKLGGSWYLSSPTIGDYETYLAQDLVAHIDANYRTIPNPESRGITGCSMGADGAVHLGLSYPGIFGVVAGMSGTYDLEHDPLWNTARHGFPGALEDLTAFSKLSWPVRWWIAGAAATASNPDMPPFYLDMPFAMVDGEAQIVAEVAERINAADCVHDVDEYLQQPTRLNGLMIYHGDSDPVADVEVVRGFDALLSQRGIEHEYLEVPGGHCDLRYAPLLQFVADHLAFEMPEEAAESATPGITSGYADNDGVKIYYEVVGEGPPFMLVHWGSGSTKDWHMFGYVDALEEDYQLILVDMRGHGKSDKPHDPSAYDAETLTRDIIAVLDELGIDKTHYFGYSLGGELGWALGRHAPERFHSLIIGGAPPAPYDGSDWAAWFLDIGAEEFAHLTEDGARSNAVWHPEIFETYAAIDPEAVAVAAVTLNAIDAWPNLPYMEMPILLYAGSMDEDFSGMSEAAQELPNATFAGLPGLDHVQAFWSLDQVLPHVTKFLAEVTAEAE